MEDNKFEGGFNIPPYRPGSAQLIVVYNNGMDSFLPDVLLTESVDQRYYDELFLGHLKSFIPPGIDPKVNLSFNSPDLRDKFLQQVKEYGYREIQRGKKYIYCGIEINIVWG